ncbi:MAG: alpha/beta fold hydrolase [Rhodobacteraceae bacterium]|nr:alpha/beta fold hydrolase [Paracoccaceae bacterium]
MVNGRPLVIVHGLYGSGRNWGVIARNLAKTRPVVTVDQRNHGASPWTDTHSYEDMAADLAQIVDDLGGQADLLGHSMGGKACMCLALTAPQKVSRLIVADIAPVTYTHSYQMDYLKAMRDMDLTGIKTRGDADRRLREAIPELAIRAFLIQSLDVEALRWKLNLPTLEKEMPKIVGFPRFDTQYDAPTLFLAGGASDYVQPEHRPEIRRLFPKAIVVKIPGTNHWLHAEKPREFETAVTEFLNRTAVTADL